MVLFLLHVRHNHQNRRGSNGPIALVPSQELPRLNAEMVSVAKAMGLGWDPEVVEYMYMGAGGHGGGGGRGAGGGGEMVKREEDVTGGSSKMTLFEKEVRRRMWGAVVCCDL
jgi:hypothetical protein